MDLSRVEERDSGMRLPAECQRKFGTGEEQCVDPVALGLPLRGEPLDGVGGKQLLIEDPAGNPIELFEPRS